MKQSMRDELLILKTKLDYITKEIEELKKDIKTIKDRLLGFLISGLMMLAGGLVSFILSRFK